jgi:glycosyltransferase involved in cell wall biosynthesis
VLAVVIPAYNAERHLDGVVKRLSRVALGDLGFVVVVNDGSNDDTARVARSVEQLPCATAVIHHPSNLGYGAAMKTGLRACLERGASRVAGLHADAQYGPESLPGLLSLLDRENCDLVQGSRIASGTARSGGMPAYKRLANAVLNRIENRVLGLGLTDYHSGFLVYGNRCLQNIEFADLSNTFEFDLEVIVSARARGYVVREHPIPTHYGDEISHLDPMRYGVAVLRTLYRYQRGFYAASSKE